MLEAERLWSLRGDTLWMEEEGRPGRAIPLKSLTRLRLEYAPTRFQLGRYRCNLYTAQGRVGVIQNEHFVGIAEFEDRSLSYHSLVKALIRRIASIHPQCRLESGVPWWSWLMNSGIMCGVFGVLGILLIYMWTVIGWLVVVKLAMIAFFLPAGIRWVTRNRPRRFSAGSIPENLLPKVAVNLPE